MFKKLIQIKFDFCHVSYKLYPLARGAFILFNLSMSVTLEFYVSCA